MSPDPTDLAAQHRPAHASRSGHARGGLLAVVAGVALVTPAAAAAEGADTTPLPAASTTTAPASTEATTPTETTPSPETPTETTPTPPPATPKPGRRPGRSDPLAVDGGGQKREDARKSVKKAREAAAREREQRREEKRRRDEQRRAGDRDADRESGGTTPDGTTPGDASADAGDPLPDAPTAVPNLFLDRFRIPPFLLPIYQAAGIQYGIRWEILAAINEIETDYGRNLSISTAGALGWMQFMPATWDTYGTDANGDGKADPYNPVDAIFSAARYLRAAGADQDIRKAIFAYNHADWYVRSVLLRARLIAGLPADLVSSLAGLTQGMFPVDRAATYDGDDAIEASQKTAKGNNAARPVESSQRRSIEIRTAPGAAAVAVQDGEVTRVGESPRLGKYVQLRDVYGNVYTYAHLKSVEAYYPAPKDPEADADRGAEPDQPPADPKPTRPATAGTVKRGAASGAGEEDRKEPLSSRPSPSPAADAEVATTAVDASRPAAAPLPPHGPLRGLPLAKAGLAAPKPKTRPRTPVAEDPANPEPAADGTIGVVDSSPRPKLRVLANPGRRQRAEANPGALPVDGPTPGAERSAPAKRPAGTRVRAAMAIDESATVAADADAARERTAPDSKPRRSRRRGSPVPPPTSSLPPLLPVPGVPEPIGDTSGGQQSRTPDQTPVESEKPAPGAEVATVTPGPYAPPTDSLTTGDGQLPAIGDRPDLAALHGLKPEQLSYRPLKRGARVLAGTSLGRVGSGTDDGEVDGPPDQAGRMTFEIRPAGREAPRIDPKPILDGWKLLESTAVYRAKGRSLFGTAGAGQVLLMSKAQLQQRVLADRNLSIYPQGRADIEAGAIDRRVLATLEYLTANGLKLTITSLRSGHGYLTASGNVSEHSSGSAVDIAALNGITITPKTQGPGTITESTIRLLLQLQGAMKPHQIISLMTFSGTDNTMSLPDHDDHIHVGFRPQATDDPKLGRQLARILKPGQWARLISRLGEIDNPKVLTQPSKYAVRVKRGR
ncbi:lytic murein transglycosylase [Patulibacter defluvii]|uniref:lytic murein transglycosylase n=1 Tax=Patulibacter defluvii TaxID=3095358 RepID=UPI002A74DA43|nr:lytic murein transglycosylase [Patulibacter sp. DM4]